MTKKAKPFWARPRNDAEAKKLGQTLVGVGDQLTRLSHAVWLLGVEMAAKRTPEQEARRAHRRIPRQAAGGAR